MAAVPHTTITGKRRTLFIAVGRPGSGKTWLASQLDVALFEVLSQDELHLDKVKFYHHIEYKINHGSRHLYIDSCNHYGQRRRTIASLGIKYKLQVVFIEFNLPIDECARAMRERIEMGVKHPSVNSIPEAKEVFLQFFKTMTFIGEDEKYPSPAVSIIKVAPREEVAQLAQKINARK